MGCMETEQGDSPPHQHPQLRVWWARWGRGRLAVPLQHRLSENTGLKFLPWVSWSMIWSSACPWAPLTKGQLVPCSICIHLAPPGHPGWVLRLLGSGNIYFEQWIAVIPAVILRTFRATTSTFHFLCLGWETPALVPVLACCWKWYNFPNY